MKLLLAGLLAGTLIPGSAAADVPTPDPGQCVIIDVKITTETATFVNPDPAATGMQLIEMCGFKAYSDTGTSRTERQLVIVDVDVTDAKVMMNAATDLTSTQGDVYVTGTTP